MGLFSRKGSRKNRCPDCSYYVMLEGYGFCAREVSAEVDVRMLSPGGIRRACVRCPEEMTCPSWQTK